MEKRKSWIKWKKLIQSPLLKVNSASIISQKMLVIDSIMILGPMCLQSVEVSVHASFIVSIIVTVVQSGCAVLAYVSYAYRGRRHHAYSSLCFMFAFWVCSDYFEIDSYNANVVGSFLLFLMASCYVLASSWDWTEESYAEEIKIHGLCAELIVSLIGTMVSSIVTVKLICLCKAWSFLILAWIVVCICIFGLVYAFQPEVQTNEEQESLGQ